MTESAGLQGLVSVRNVDKVFKRGSEEIHVLGGLDLQIPEGEFLALMGPSGSGKSTLIRCINRLEALLLLSAWVFLGSLPTGNINGAWGLLWARLGLFIYVFEILVAVLQAYIFTLLSAVYIQTSVEVEAH